MPYQRYYGYQYETSPRKVQPEYEPNRKNRQYKKSTAVKKEEQQPVAKPKTKMSSKGKTVLYIAIAFAVLFGIGYRNSLITEQFSKKEKLKTQLSSLQKENEQLKVNIESNLNLNHVEEVAKEKLGMQKLDNRQKVYINLPKKDYIEAATEKVLIEEDEGFWKKLWRGVTEAID